MATSRAIRNLANPAIPTYFVACILLHSSAMSSAMAQASGDVESQLASMREMVTFARFDEVIAPLAELLERDDLSAAQRISALELLAAARVIERAPGAGETLELLYRRDPGHRLSLPDVSPELFAAFSRARDAHTDALPVGLVHDPPSVISRTDPTVEVRVMDGRDAVHILRLSYREGSGPYQRTEVPLGADGTARVRIPPPSEGDSASVDYYFEALAPSGTPIASAGSTEGPFHVAFGTTAAPEIASGDGTGEPGTGGGDDTWWIVTLVAVLLVGGGVGIGVGVFLSTGSQGPPDGSLGTFVLSLRADW